jgi:hypothetical protein
MLGFASTASMADRGEKFGGDPWIDQPTCYGFGREPSFLGAVALLNSVDDYEKGCHTQTKHGMCMAY